MLHPHTPYHCHGVPIKWYDLLTWPARLTKSPADLRTPDCRQQGVVLFRYGIRATVVAGLLARSSKLVLTAAHHRARLGESNCRSRSIRGKRYTSFTSPTHVATSPTTFYTSTIAQERTYTSSQFTSSREPRHEYQNVQFLNSRVRQPSQQTPLQRAPVNQYDKQVTCHAQRASSTRRLETTFPANTITDRHHQSARYSFL